jgi:hypothetical protein
MWDRAPGRVRESAHSVRSKERGAMAVVVNMRTDGHGGLSVDEE